jgi:hypothetical protein
MLFSRRTQACSAIRTVARVVGIVGHDGVVLGVGHVGVSSKVVNAIKVAEER